MGNKSKKHLHSVPAPVAPAAVPAAAPPVTHEVGAVVEVPETVAAALGGIQGHLNELQRLLGVLVADYMARRDLLLRNHAETQQAYNEQVKQVAIGLGINLGPESQERWTYTPDKRTFVRQA